MHKMQVAGAEVLVKQIIERLTGVIDATVFCLDGIGELGHQLIDAGTPVIDLGRKPGLDWSVAGRLATEIKHATSKCFTLTNTHRFSTQHWQDCVTECRQKSSSPNTVGTTQISFLGNGG